MNNTIDITLLVNIVILVLITAICAGIAWVIARWKPESRSIIFGFAFLGLLIGILTGASLTPVVGTVVPAVLTFVGGVGGLLTILRKNGLKEQRLVGTLLVSFCLSMILGTFYGAESRLSRTRDIPPPRVSAPVAIAEPTSTTTPPTPIAEPTLTYTVTPPTPPSSHILWNIAGKQFIIKRLGWPPLRIVVFSWSKATAIQEVLEKDSDKMQRKEALAQILTPDTYVWYKISDADPYTRAKWEDVTIRKQILDWMTDPNTFVSVEEFMLQFGVTIPKAEQATAFLEILRQSGLSERQKREALTEILSDDIRIWFKIPGELIIDNWGDIPPTDQDEFLKWMLFFEGSIMPQTPFQFYP